MTERGTDADPHSIAGLLGRLVEDGQKLVRAEAGLYRALALHRLSLSRGALIMLAAAILIMLAALIMLLVMIAIALSARFGPLGAGLLVALVAVGAAAVLAALGYRRLRAVSALSDEDEPA